MGLWERALNKDDEAATAGWSRTPSPPTAAWEPEESTRRDHRFESSPKVKRGQGGGARTELFRHLHAGRMNYTGHPPVAWLAHRFRSR